MLTMPEISQGTIRGQGRLFRELVRVLDAEIWPVERRMQSIYVMALDV